MIKYSIFILLLNLILKPEANASIFNELSNSNITNKVFAHASGMGLTPNGNTLLAAMRSIYYGVDGLEMDIRSTKDGIYVLYHDDTVQQYIYDDLHKELNLPWGQTVPKLSEMFSLLESVKLYSNRDIDVLFDIKEAKDVEGILNYTYQQNFTNRYGLVSYDFTRDILDNGKKWSKMMGVDIPTMVIISSNVSFGLYNTRMWGYGIVSFLYEDLSTEIIEEAKNYNPPINVTCLLVNDIEKIENVSKLGVLGFGTDYPELTYLHKNHNSSYLKYLKKDKDTCSIKQYLNEGTCYEEVSFSFKTYFFIVVYILMIVICILLGYLH